MPSLSFAVEHYAICLVNQGVAIYLTYKIYYLRFDLSACWPYSWRTFLSSFCGQNITNLVRSKSGQMISLHSILWQDVKGPQTVAFNLPNDESIVKDRGTSMVMLKNVSEAKYKLSPLRLLFFNILFFNAPVMFSLLADDFLFIW